jgi:hypothetical protein
MQNETQLSLCDLFFGLSQNNTFIRQGVEYMLDIDEYDRRMKNNRNLKYKLIYNCKKGLIENKLFDEQMNFLLNDSLKYNVIDKYNKTCGSYDVATKTLNLFLRQVKIDDNVYYCNSTDRKVFKYDGEELGILSCDGTEIITYDTLFDCIYLTNYLPRD